MGRTIEYIEDYIAAPDGTTVEAVTGHDDDDNKIITRWRKSAAYEGWVIISDGGIPVPEGWVMTDEQMADDGPVEVVED